MTDNSKPPATRPPPSRLDLLARRAAWVLLAERLWPVLVLAAVLAAAFVTLSWLGAWVGAPRAVRVAAIVVLVAGLAGTVVLGVRAARVTRREALARLDRDSGLDHRPASALEDTLATGAQDPFTLALWQASRRRLEAAVSRLRVRPPQPRIAERDPYAVRAVALLALVAAAFVAGDGKDGLLAAAFDWRTPGAAGAAFRVDAWVDPPGYTGRAPLVLFAATPTPASLAVPVHSAVVVRSSGGGAPDVTVAGGLKPVEAPPPGAAPAPSKGATTRPGGDPAAAVVERRFVLDGDGVLTLGTGSGQTHTVHLTATPDLPPTIAMTGSLRPTERGGLTLGYTIGDDYGVVAAEATFADPVVDGAPPVRALVPSPKLPLNLPPTAGGLGAGQTTGDLSDHPWAGAEVTAVLSARDEGGNVGLSGPVRVTLPARPFANPLARALVEQRRTLVFDPDHRDGIATALDALMIEPDQFTPSKAVYLGLYTARQRLAAARSDDDLVSLAAYLWQMALHLEEGDKTNAQRDLQAAEQALREAMARNAPPDEIKRLTDELRKAMDRMLAEMARNPDTARRNTPRDPNARTVTPDQLRQMMQRMEDLAKSGNVAEAQRMLDRLQSMLDNLRTAGRNGANEARREMNRQMGELDKMTRDQQALRDRTYKQGREQPGSDDDNDADDPGAQGQQPAPQEGSPGSEDSADLQRQQQALRDRLSDLQRRMRQLGMKGEKGLEDAEAAMKDAEGALGQGEGGNRKAVEAQGRALQGLQQGANGVAQQMAEGQGESGGAQQGESEGSGGPSISQGNPGQDGNDPLGRPRDGRGTMETRGRAVEEGVAERAQRVLQELRRRLGDPGRPAAETDYLERLLQPY